MLECICGMVEKTQSAISILGQRKSETVNIQNTEELVAEVQSKAHIAIGEVKDAALEEIKQAESQKNHKMSDDRNSSKTEVITSSTIIRLSFFSFSSLVGTVGTLLL